MRRPALQLSLFNLVLAVTCLIIFLLPFHALMSVWAASNFGHYTLFRLWKEFLLLGISLYVIWLLIVDAGIRKTIFRHKLTWLIIAYAAIDLLIGGIAFHNRVVSTKALAYGILDDLRFPYFFMVCWILAERAKALSGYWPKLLVWPAYAVVVFGLLQMSVLPANVLTHFGYGPRTILPFETINNNPNYVRILSTLRGANPLGAYLILPISAAAVIFIRDKTRQRWLALVLLLASVVVLFGSYSRSAWIGAVLALGVIVLMQLNRQLMVRFKVVFIAATVVVLVLVGSAFVLLHNSSRFQNLIFHSQTHSASPVSSDQAHLSAIMQGFKDLVNHPFGTGPGTSGPASVYNHLRPASIPENYFLEVGQESGWLGLLLFILINVYVAYLLFKRRAHPLALLLLASLVGITFVNLLSLAWTDDTLSYIWWGLAGMAITLPPDNNNYVKREKALAKIKKPWKIAKQIQA